MIINQSGQPFNHQHNMTSNCNLIRHLVCQFCASACDSLGLGASPARVREGGLISDLDSNYIYFSFLCPLPQNKERRREENLFMFSYTCSYM